MGNGVYSERCCDILRRTFKMMKASAFKLFWESSAWIFDWRMGSLNYDSFWVRTGGSCWRLKCRCRNYGKRYKTMLFSVETIRSWPLNYSKWRFQSRELGRLWIDQKGQVEIVSVSMEVGHRISKNERLGTKATVF